MQMLGVGRLGGSHCVFVCVCVCVCVPISVPTLSLSLPLSLYGVLGFLACSVQLRYVLDACFKSLLHCFKPNYIRCEHRFWVLIMHTRGYKRLPGCL